MSDIGDFEVNPLSDRKPVELDKSRTHVMQRLTDGVTKWVNEF